MSAHPECTRCPLHRTTSRPGIDGSGPLDAKLVLVGEAPGCIAGDSLIDTAYRDKSVYPKGIPIQDLVGATNVSVYSFDPVTRELKLGRVLDVWHSGRKPTYRVTYTWHQPPGHRELHASLVVTANHPFLLRRRPKGLHDPYLGCNGSWTQPYLSLEQGLQVGHSLEPFLRGGEGVRSTIATAQGRFVEANWLLRQKLGRPLATKEECHHIDRNPLNDSWDNLQLETTSSHARIHGLEDNPMADPQIRMKHAAIMASERYRTAMSGKMKAVFQDPTAYTKRVEEIRSYAGRISTTVKAKFENDPDYYLRFLKGRQRCFDWTDDEVQRRWLARFPQNHLIVAIEEVGTQDVYDLEVEDLHNFAVNGVFVHNSDEERTGLPFVGSAGKVLDQALTAVGLTRADVRITNSVRCRPPQNATPTREPLAACFPYLAEELAEIKPKVVLALGGTALQALTGRTGVTTNRGKVLDPSSKVRVGDAKFVATNHPAAILHHRGGNELAYIIQDLRYAKVLAGIDSPDLPLHERRVLLPGYSYDELWAALDWVDADRVALDCEWTALPDRPISWPWSHDAELLSFALAGRVGDTIRSVALAWPPSADGRLLLQAVLPTRRVVFHNAMADLTWLKSVGIILDVASDTMVLAHLLDEQQPLGLERLGSQAGIPPWKVDKTWEKRPTAEEEWRHILSYNCFPADTLVTSPTPIDAVSKRWYEGPFVEITTKRGHKLAGTPNHPIFTSRGKVGLGALVVGDSIVSRSFGEKMCSRKVDPQDTDTPISEIFDFREDARITQAVHHGTVRDFHGDGQDTDVYVITSDSLLEGRGKAPAEQPLGKDSFPISHQLQGTLSSDSSEFEPSLLSWSPSNCSGHRFGDLRFIHRTKLRDIQSPRLSSSAKNSGVFESAFNERTTATQQPPNLSGTATLLIERDYVIGVNGAELLHTRDVPCPSQRAQFDTSLYQSFSDQATSQAEVSSDGMSALSGEVMADEVSSIRRYDFAGHVYNLSTTDHTYYANSILVSNCDDVYATLLVEDALKQQLKQRTSVEQQNTIRMLFHLLLPAIPMFVDMASAGVPIDRDALKLAIGATQQRQNEAADALIALIGEGLGREAAITLANSTDQTQKLLKDYGVQLESSRKDQLADLVDTVPVTAPILAIRKATKMRGTFLERWSELFDEQRTNRLHSVYGIVNSRTGRTSAQVEKGGSLQVMPREPWVREMVRAKPGCVIITADYSQLELRLIAWLANERHMREIYMESRDADLHRATGGYLLALSQLTASDGELSASEYWRVRDRYMPQVTGDTRQAAKGSNFGLCYGQEWQGFQRYCWQHYKVRLSDQQAMRYRAGYFDLYPDLIPWHRQGVDIANRGWCVTPFGRYRRQLEDFRKAVNTPIQAMGTDLCVLAETEVWHTLRKERTPARLIGFVHDSILCEATAEAAEDTMAIIKSCMENPPLDALGVSSLPVPLIAEITVGEKWSK